ncbi:hypothetical protein KI387_005876, partial [Taxus chinensis]
MLPLWTLVAVMGSKCPDQGLVRVANSVNNIFIVTLGPNWLPHDTIDEGDNPTRAFKYSLGILSYLLLVKNGQELLCYKYIDQSLRLPTGIHIEAGCTRHVNLFLST